MIQLLPSVGLGHSFVRVDGLGSAFGLKPAFRQGLELGVGFKVQVKVMKRSTRYIIAFVACVGLA